MAKKKIKFQAKNLRYSLLILAILFVGFGSFIYFHKPSDRYTHIAKIYPTTVPTQQDVSITTANWKTYTIASDPTFRFKLPPDWKDLEFWNPMPPNAYGIQSPDFKSERNGYKISNGSIITIVINDHQGPNAPTEEEAALAAGNGEAKIIGYYQTADFKAIKFTHHCCEDIRSVYEFIFFKDGKEYKIEQDYRLNSQNPYPNLLEQIVSTFTFTK